MILPKVDIKRILYATDLSESARHAFAYAVSLANLYGASITLLHTLDETPELVDKGVVGYIGAERWEEIKKQHYQEARKSLVGKKRDSVPIREVLDQFCENAKSSQENHDFIADEILVIKGHPADEILTQAEKRNCDLIVMGTQGHGILEDALLGSTARRVVRRSKKPVLVVRLPEED
ncbi:MAG: universal stress protein [Desulfobacteraceae bacterium]|nr:universal stress protein [Desulfobacteraceae bacterium]MDH3721151.1 universal stress protein [Desulfobacteraceae bacterium]MDH3836127.1 universal stress protein [Desulfobacteraceae bacterium]MDH3874924.1 universal stress protein [Desulfobacteraceae bacterium]MDH3880527.1 universal stress protein [Desulfobacteraceae bacterium]